MMYCKHCGKQIEEGQICPCQEENKRNQEAPTKVIFIVATLITIIATIVCITCFKRDNTPPDNSSQNSPGNQNSAGTDNNETASVKIDPFEHIDVSFVGLNHYGTIDISYNRQELIEHFIGKANADFSEEELNEYDLLYIGFDYVLDFTVSKEHGIANGDRIIITCVVPEDAQDKLAISQKEYIVEGLDSPTYIDVFSNMSIIYNGVSGQATAEVDKSGSSDILIDCDYEISPNSNLSNGDEITVTLSEHSISILEEHGKIPYEISKTYTVKGLSEYVAYVDQLPQEHIQQIANRHLNEQNPEDDFLFSYGEPQIYGIYFMELKEGKTWGYQNILKVVVCYDEYLRGEYNETVYKPLDFYNITLNSDGSIDLDYEDGHKDGFYTDIEDHLSSFENDYDVFDISNHSKKAYSSDIVNK